MPIKSACFISLFSATWIVSLLLDCSDDRSFTYTWMLLEGKVSMTPVSFTLSYDSFAISISVWAISMFTLTFLFFLIGGGTTYYACDFCLWKFCLLSLENSKSMVLYYLYLYFLWFSTLIKLPFVFLFKVFSFWSVFSSEIFLESVFFYIVLNTFCMWLIFFNVTASRSFRIWCICSLIFWSLNVQRCNTLASMR